MSISSAHSAAARENGAKSHGPVTAEGKARSARNARKHGLFGAIVLDSASDREAYSELLEAYIDEFQPDSIFEHRCVREMVDAEWRLAAVRRTIGSIEAAHVAAAPADATPAQARAHAFERLANSGNALSLALRYEKHFQRQYEKAHQALMAARRAETREREAFDRSADRELVAMLKAVVEAPLPPFRPPAQGNLRNEPKPPAPKPQNGAFNPCLLSKR